MTNQCGGAAVEQETAAERIQEARQLYATIKRTITAVIEDLESGVFTEARLVKTEIAKLTDVLHTIQKREQEFDDTFGNTLARGEIDLREARSQIGCRLARLRRCCDGGEVS